MPAIPIDFATVNWTYVAILSVFVLIASFVANLLSFNSKGIGAILAAVLFAAMFIAWTYYPHGLPFPTRL
jgi:hypothetical protein